MPDITTTYEVIRGREPNAAGFSRQGGGRRTVTRIIGDKGGGTGSITSAKQIHDAIREILGFTSPAVDGLSLDRRMPKADAIYPWLFAERITNIAGLGRMTQVDSDPGGILEADPWDTTALYPAYEITTEFAPRPYAVASNLDIDTGSLTWTHDDGTTTSTPSYAKEWLRYTDIEILPAATWITAESGQFKFDVSGGAEPDTYQALKGQIKMLYPDTMLRVTWFEVPYSYIDAIDSTDTRIDSYILQGLGHVNQFQWYGFAAGSLLLHAVNIGRYTPPVPDFDYWQGSKIFTGEKLCDITFMIGYRDIGPRAAPAAPSPANANIVQYGFNVHPYAHTGNWYYAKTNVPGSSTNSNKPAFPSFPFELLFTNPGV